MTSSFVIAIDGPAASGKGTLARRLAEHLGFPHLDTGLSYRAVAFQLLQNDLPLDDEQLAVKAARNLDLGKLDRNVLSAHETGNAASRVAAMPSVRKVLVEQQQEFAGRPPGAVLDGRDIGTVVCPDAQVKLYISASPEERARRRWNEMQAKGQTGDFDAVLNDIRARDERDSSRADSPLKPAQDAHLLDTTEMDIETAFKTALGIVKQAQSV